MKNKYYQTHGVIPTEGTEIIKSRRVNLHYSVSICYEQSHLDHSKTLTTRICFLVSHRCVFELYLRCASTKNTRIKLIFVPTEHRVTDTRPCIRRHTWRAPVLLFCRRKRYRVPPGTLIEAEFIGFNGIHGWYPRKVGPISTI